MFRVLIVDDEQIERDGIKLLLKRYVPQLETVEAEDGEVAYEYLKSNPVDILLTDIKMPFMDGMELSKKARELYADIKIIIFSAYGEFEYAKKAIHFNAFYYLLKPVDTNEFQKVFLDVVKLCEKEYLDKELNDKMLKAYHKEIVYEKELFLFDILNGYMKSEQLEARMNQIGMDFSDKHLQMFLIDFKIKFFDKHNEEFKNLLNELISYEFEYINLNESQSLIFLINENDIFEKTQSYYLGQVLQEKILTLFNEKITIVISKAIVGIDKLSEEFNNIETILEYKFFFKEGLILFSDSGFEKGLISEKTIEELIENIYDYINSRDFYSLKKGLDIFFDTVPKNDEHSPLYVKYICTEIVKSVIKLYDDENTKRFSVYVDSIFKTDSLLQLKQILWSIITNIEENLQSNSNENTKKVIKDTLKLIEENYMNDISLDWIAEKVYLSRSYLSYLFKQETGQSLIKYITLFRLEKASKLLKDTNMKIVDIVKKVGYTDQSYFCLNFKNYYGITPAKFREKRE